MSSIIWRESRLLLHLIAFPVSWYVKKNNIAVTPSPRKECQQILILLLFDISCALFVAAVVKGTTPVSCHNKMASFIIRDY